MNTISSIIFTLICLAAVTSGYVRPHSKLYFSIPIGPAVTQAAVTTQATTTAATTTAATTTAAAGSTTAASAQSQLNFIPLGQLLGMLFGGFLNTIFGNTLPNGQTATAVQVMPLFQALGNLFGG